MNSTREVIYPNAKEFPTFSSWAKFSFIGMSGKTVLVEIQESKIIQENLVLEKRSISGITFLFVFLVFDFVLFCFVTGLEK